MTPKSDVPLAPLCTMGVGGPARWLAHARQAADVCQALQWAEKHGVPVQVLGGGSNVVIADDGFDGLVLHVDIRGIEMSRADRHMVYDVGAGEPWDGFVAATVADNCAGVECLSGIPGRVGGTPVQNVGAYGQDVSGTIIRVVAVDRHAQRTVTMSNAECGFGYRSSRFKRDSVQRFIVTQVAFALRPDGPPTVTYADVIRHFGERDDGLPTTAAVREAVLTIRRGKGMVIEAGSDAIRSCGSFFLNPVVSREHYDRIERQAGDAVPGYPADAGSVKIPAAWLIERAGFPKGMRRGAVSISPFQAQAIVNLGGASAADVVALACEVKRAVWNAFDVSLVPEPVFVGFRPTDELRSLCRHW
jgi:UDP-N-acetylmuramate dehydrogenase